MFFMIQDEWLYIGKGSFDLNNVIQVKCVKGDVIHVKGESDRYRK